MNDLTMVDGREGYRGQVCIASRGKVKKLYIEVISSENTTIAVVFYRALEFNKSCFPEGNWGTSLVLPSILAYVKRRANRLYAGV